MKIGELYGAHPGQDIYVVGTGPSMRVFPKEILEGKICIGLNQAWKYGIDLQYSITIHPQHVVDHEVARKKDPSLPPTKWCIRTQKPPLRITLEDKRYYGFTSHKPIPSHGFNHNLITKRWPNALFIGRGIHQSAMNLAYHMGAKTIFLVGVDMCSLDGEHHGHAQHTQFHGLESTDVYEEYRIFTDYCRQAIHRLGVPVVTL